jgi:hypothetical protein
LNPYLYYAALAPAHSTVDSVVEGVVETVYRPSKVKIKAKYIPNRSVLRLLQPVQLHHGKISQ